LRASYEDKLKGIQQGSLQQEQEASLAALALKQQVSQLTTDRERLQADLKARETEIRLLRKQINQKQIENRRMSVVRSGESWLCLNFQLKPLFPVLYESRQVTSDFKW